MPEPTGVQNVTNPVNPSGTRPPDPVSINQKPAEAPNPTAQPATPGKSPEPIAQTPPLNPEAIAQTKGVVNTGTPDGSARQDQPPASPEYPEEVKIKLQAIDHIVDLAASGDPEAMKVVQKAIQSAKGSVPRPGAAGLPDVDIFSYGQRPQQSAIPTAGPAAHGVAPQSGPKTVNDFMPPGVMYNQMEALSDPNSPSAQANLRYQQHLVDASIRKHLSEQNALQERARANQQFNVTVRTVAEKFGADEPRVKEFHQTILDRMKPGAGSQATTIENIYKGMYFDELVEKQVATRVEEVLMRIKTNLGIDISSDSLARLSTPAGGTAPSAPAGHPNGKPSGQWTSEEGQRLLRKR